MASTQIIIIAIIYESILTILCLLITKSIWSRYQSRKSNIAKQLFLAFMCICIFFILLVINRFIRLAGKNVLPSGGYIEIGAISVAFLVIADVFYFAFCLELFYKEYQSQKNRHLQRIFEIAAMIGAVYIVVTGIFVLDLTETIWIIIFTFSMVLSIFWVWSGMKILKKASGESREDRISMQIVVSGPIFMTLVMFFMILDRIFGSAFTVWYFIGQTCTMLSLFVVYVGFIRPQWFLNLLQKHAPW